MTSEQTGKDVVARRAVVRGLVQGVFFRDSCRTEADRCGLAGSAENRADGSVVVVLEGGPEAVATVLRWLREGPPGADVDEVEVTEIEATGRRGFDVG